MGFNEFIEENNITYDHEFGYFKIYSSVAVGSTDIIRTTGSFYGHEWFSNVAIFAEDTIWYEKVSTRAPNGSGRVGSGQLPYPTRSIGSGRVTGQNGSEPVRRVLNLTNQ